MKINNKLMFAIAVIVVCSALSGCGTNSDAVKSNANEKDPVFSNNNRKSNANEKDPVFSNNNSEGDIVGADWRTTGIIIDYGTITRGGENTEVAITMKRGKSSFYYDSPNQQLFESVLFPKEVEDSWGAFSSISFEDINGDGESDATIDFSHEDNSKTHFVWLWEQENGYMYQENQSYFHKQIMGE